MDDAYDLSFSVPDTRHVRLLMRYDGPAKLSLLDATLFEEEVLE